ncbi:MAG: hypothetical protein U0325_10335 [Polyangiales bacterium]
MTAAPPRRRPSPEALLALTFTLAAAMVGQSGLLPDDEGYLTFLGAHLVAHEPRAALFFPKIHPSASALLAPFAAFGWRAFLVAHAAFAGLAVYLLGRVARRLTPHAPWAPALLLATSPLYLLSAATGQSNSTAVFFFAASLFLIEGAPPARLAAGALAAAGIWARYEQAPYLLALVGFDALGRRRGHALAAFVATTVAYLGAGALYHHNAAWLFARPPVLLREAGPTTMTELARGAEGLASLLTSLALASPLGAAALSVRRATLTPEMRALAATLALALAAQLVLPQLGGLFNYDYTARYFLCHLPVSSLLAAASLAPGAAPRACAPLMAAGAALALWLRGSARGLAGALWLAAPWILSWGPRRRVALVALAALGTVGASLVVRRHTSAIPVDGLPVAADLVRRVPAGVAVYTNTHQLQALLDARGDARRVRFLVGYDMVIELAAELGGRRTAQSDAVFRSLGPILYGRALWPCEMPHAPPVGSLLVLADSARSNAMYDLDAWRGAAEPVLQVGRTEVWRVRRPVQVPRRALPPWMPPASFELACVAGRGS